jgi:hypothetical protein
MKTKLFQKQLSRTALKTVLAGGEGCTNVYARGGEECVYPFVCGLYGCELSGNSGGGSGGGTGSGGSGGGGGGTGGGIGGPDPEQTT